MSDELNMMVACLLRKMTFRCKTTNRRFVLTSFKSRREAVLSEIDEHGNGTGHTMTVKTLDNFVKED